MSPEAYSKKYPNARASTLALLKLRDAKTAEPKHGNIEARKPKNKLAANVLALRKLIGWV